MAIHFTNNPPSGTSRPDLSGLDAVIRLKADLLSRLATTHASTWPRHVIQFVSALERSDLTDTTALLVLLTELRQELQFLLGAADQTDAHLSAGRPAFDLRADLRRGDMLAHFRQHMLDVLLPAARRRPASPIAEEIKGLIDERYAERLTLDMLSTAVGRSKRHLASVFLREFGVSVHRYQTRVRLNRALTLIREGEKIEAVSLLVGYRSKKNFYRNFSEHIGVTPTAYRTTLASLQKSPGT